jgi:hypothetical protein
VGLVGAQPSSDIKALPAHTPAKAPIDGKEQFKTVAHPATRVVDGGEA